MNEKDRDLNLDQDVIDGFGFEWSKFDYSDQKAETALDKQFAAYCHPIDLLRYSEKSSIAADFGAGSGRWTLRLLPYFHKVYALEPSDVACQVLRKKFNQNPKVTVLQESVGVNSIPDNSLDLAVSFGVLHHIPDTALALSKVAQKIKPGSFLLCYLYYKLDDKDVLYRALFKVADKLRGHITKLSSRKKRAVTWMIAALIYLPLARFSKLLKCMKIRVSNIPLHHYADMPFVMLANDALDRFGTSLEQRFDKNEISAMLNSANFDTETLYFSEKEPYWCFSVKKNL
jgi:SAM-dependent methyltransferase